MIGRTAGTRRGGTNLILLLTYLIFGLYFINYPFNFLGLPAAIISTAINKWIIFVSGILMILGAINYFRIKQVYPY
jgi:hypothetical protein